MHVLGLRDPTRARAPRLGSPNPPPDKLATLLDLDLGTGHLVIPPTPDRPKTHNQDAARAPSALTPERRQIPQAHI
jgi:hypothetical protein